MRIKQITAPILLSFPLVFVFALEAFAWGPERPTYTNDEPADHAVFNSITDNPVLGDERDFVRIVEKKLDAEAEKESYTSEIILEADKQYEVIIYFHNNASASLNDEAHNYVGIARDVRLSSGFPNQLSKSERQAVAGRITSTSTDPEVVWDEAYVTAKEAITLHYVTGSAKFHNDWEANGQVLSTNLFSSEGTFLGLNDLNGMILGCYEFSGYVTYTIQTHAVNEDVLEETITLETPEISAKELQKLEESEDVVNQEGQSKYSVVTMTVVGFIIMGSIIFVKKLLHKK